MEGRPAGQLGALDERHVTPAQAREPVEDRTTADSPADHDHACSVDHGVSSVTSLAKLSIPKTDGVASEYRPLLCFERMNCAAKLQMATEDFAFQRDAAHSNRQRRRVVDHDRTLSNGRPTASRT